MGKFDGVLLASDFDNTLVFTEEALRSGTGMPPLPERNREAILYFVENGGRFAISTGRALTAFRRFADLVPMNAPGVVCNGAALYDFQEKRYVYTAFLEESCRERGMEILNRFPAVGCEIFHESDTVHAVHANELTRMHQHLTHAAYVEVEDLWGATEPCAKLLFEAEQSELEALRDYILTKPWGGEYELIFSSDHLLEMTAKGANKGGMVLRLAQLLDISRENIYCIGDHANDLSMLQAAAQGFAPENCIDDVRASGAHIVSHCKDGAVADVVALLDIQYR